MIDLDIENKIKDIIKNKYPCSLWINKDNANIIKKFMNYDSDNKQYFANFGILTISPLNKCGYFHYKGYYTIRENIKKVEMQIYQIEDIIYKKENEKKGLFDKYFNSPENNRKVIENEITPLIQNIDKDIKELNEKIKELKEVLKC